MIMIVTILIFVAIQGIELIDLRSIRLIKTIERSAFILANGSNAAAISGGATTALFGIVV